MALTAKAKWKEEMHVVDEEGRSFMFECGWGSDPLVAYVPPVEQWTACVPAWLHDRRDEAIAAMRARNHRIDDGWYAPLPKGANT
jgi:hypothetical protein